MSENFETKTMTISYKGNKVTIEGKYFADYADIVFFNVTTGEPMDSFEEALNVNNIDDELNEEQERMIELYDENIDSVIEEHLYGEGNINLEDYENDDDEEDENKFFPNDDDDDLENFIEAWDNSDEEAAFYEGQYSTSTEPEHFYFGEIGLLKDLAREEGVSLTEMQLKILQNIFDEEQAKEILERVGWSE